MTERQPWSWSSCQKVIVLSFCDWQKAFFFSGFCKTCLYNSDYIALADGMKSSPAETEAGWMVESHKTLNRL